MADNKSKRDRQDEQADDNAEFNNYDSSEVGDAGGQAGGTGYSDMEEDFYADDESTS
jgi:hypothetical protein